MKMRILLLAVFLGLFVVKNHAQRNVKDSSIFMPLLSVDYSALFPAGDFQDRFSFTNGIGGSIDFKTKKKFIFGVHGSFLFGQNVKESIQFGDVVNADGSVTNVSGSIGNAALKMRGFNVNLDFGYLLTFSKPNPNSGIFFKFGIGYIQNMVYIQNVEDNIPQINGEYKKGYDRFSVGMNISQHIGYQFMHNKGIWNFHVGFYISEGMTKNIRYNFDTKSKNPDLQLDIIYGIKLGWIIPVYKRKPDKYYFS